ncbi:hypothetical protein P154DRAFT_624868 [Amniculicola lignicola CBS 123094]|uniref:Uncharacterized protein n=1 Tax=Amniculicola lignicola CBS 123094 TaxID=1392246 RepID=A0A6A5VWW5_9PLEO|nr:hypothetical protein P154DRAFT_624868 [Amniculicola lignicola CBS 123094]
MPETVQKRNSDPSPMSGPTPTPSPPAPNRTILNGIPKAATPTLSASSSSSPTPPPVLHSDVDALSNDDLVVDHDVAIYRSVCMKRNSAADAGIITDNGNDNVEDGLVFNIDLTDAMNLGTGVLIGTRDMWNAVVAKGALGSSALRDIAGLGRAMAAKGGGRFECPISFHAMSESLSYAVI